MKKHQRLKLIFFVLVCLAASLGLTLYALRGNVSYFRAPAETAGIAAGQNFRLGGMVVEGSLSERRDDLAVAFRVTDFKAEVAVEYKGLLPDLFREGQGVVANGAFDDRRVYVATQVLAKHDEKYMPPEMKGKMGEKP